MNRVVVLVLTVLAILISPLSQISADEAYLNPQRLAGGSILAEEEHPSISLDRELLFVHVPPPSLAEAEEDLRRLGYSRVGESAEFIAIFEFNRPDGRDDEVVDVSFPLEIRSGDFITSRPMDDEFHEGLLASSAARDRPDPERPGERIRTVEVPVSDYPAARSDIHIRQDGNDVQIDSVLIERRRTERETI